MREEAHIMSEEENTSVLFLHKLFLVITNETVRQEKKQEMNRRGGQATCGCFCIASFFSLTLSLSLFISLSLIIFVSYFDSLFLSLLPWLLFSLCHSQIRFPSLSLPCLLPCESSFFLLNDRGRRTGGRKGRRRRKRGSEGTKRI